MGKPESTVEDYLVAQANRRGFLCWKFVSPGVNGVPDRVLIGAGRVIFIECKAPGGKPRALQDVRLDEIRARGADARVCSSRESVDALMGELCRSPPENP